jgi:hypothetical protein
MKEAHMNEKQILMSVAIIAAAAAIVSLLGVSLPPPAAWLEAWTMWVASVVGIVVSARVLWVGGDALIKYSNSS